MKISRFNSLIARLAKVYSEDMTAGAGGVFGLASSMIHPAGEEQGDFYAPDDARNPDMMGTYSRKGRVKKKKAKKKPLPKFRTQG